MVHGRDDDCQDNHKVLPNKIMDHIMNSSMYV